MEERKWSVSHNGITKIDNFYNLTRIRTEIRATRTMVSGQEDILRLYVSVNNLQRVDVLESFQAGFSHESNFTNIHRFVSIEIAQLRQADTKLFEYQAMMVQGIYRSDEFHNARTALRGR